MGITEPYRPPGFHRLTPASEIEGRVAKAQKALAENEIDALLVVYPVDLFYFSGTMQAAVLLLPSRGAPLLAVRKDRARARAESPLEDIIDLHGLTPLGDLVRRRLGGEPRRLGLPLDVLPVNFYQKFRRLFPTADLVDASPLIMNLRAVKSAFEIEAMKRSGRLAQQVYDRIPDMIKPGMTEIELAGMISREAYAGGHQNGLRIRAFDKETYSWHVTSGASGGIQSRLDASFAGYGLSPAFPMGASLKKINPGEPVLIDFGICLDGYQVDLTRMFSLGPPPDWAAEAYEGLQDIEALMLENLRPGAVEESLYHLSVARAEKLSFQNAFLGAPGQKAGFAGHGVGLEINDPPTLAPGRTSTIEAGMTVALELKMVFPGQGAVGLENTVLVTEGEPIKLTTAGEEFMAV